MNLVFAKCMVLEKFLMNTNEMTTKFVDSRGAISLPWSGIIQAYEYPL